MSEEAPKRRTFAKIYLEITNRCNLSCPFCPPTRRKAEALSLERFKAILERLEGHGRLLYFHLKGEPLLHPEIGEFLALAGERGFSVSLTTNGSLLAEKGPVLIGAKNLNKLSVSLHSHSEAAGAAAGIEAYWRGVEAFLDRHRLCPRFPVSLRLWNRSDGALPPGDKRLWELLCSRYPELGGWKEASARGTSFRLAERVYLNQAEEFTWPDLSLPAINEEGFCWALRDQIGVLVDGTIVPCCLDGEGVLGLGNIFDAPLDAILESPRARAIYEGFSRRALAEPLCRTCGFLKRRLSSSRDQSPR